MRSNIRWVANNAHQPTYQLQYASPLGFIVIKATAEAILTCEFCESIESAPPLSKASYPPLLQTCLNQLTAYFQGQRQTFDLPLQLTGTEFYRQVWQQLQQIPYGETCSYATVAKAIGKPKAFRAVGQANHRNPWPIIIPCHRVINQNGQLGGYGSGLWRKTWLLRHEGVKV